MHRFVTLLNARRVLRDVEHEQQRVTLNQLIREAQMTWHGVRLYEPDWRHSSHSVAFTARLTREGILVHAILNAYWEPLEFELPPAGRDGGDEWLRWIDTFLRHKPSYESTIFTIRKHIMEAKIGKLPLAEVSPGKIDLFLTEKERVLSASGRARRLRHRRRCVRQPVADPSAQGPYIQRFPGSDRHS